MTLLSVMCGSDCHSRGTHSQSRPGTTSPDRDILVTFFSTDRGSFLADKAAGVWSWPLTSI